MNVLVEKNNDLPLYIDPWAITIRSDETWRSMHNYITKYFEDVLSLIKEGDDDKARKLLWETSEFKEAKLGHSRWGYGRWMWWGDYAEAMFDALKCSKAVSSGYLKNIEEATLIIEWIGYDRISDMVWNIIKSHLIEYTEEQCKLHGIPTWECFWKIIWNGKEWIDLEKANLPYLEEHWWLILVPKSIVRKGYLSINSSDFYKKHILPFEQVRHLEAGTSLCRTWKTGTRKWDLREPAKKIFKRL